MNLFGRKKKSAPTPSDTIQSLRSEIENMNKREDFLEKQIGTLKDDAKTAARANSKNRALYLLKKSKMKEKELETLFNMKMNMEIQISAIEQGIGNIGVFNSMQSGKTAMKNLRAEADIDAVEDTLDDINEEIDMMNEISNALSNPIGEIFDDDDLLSELEKLEEEEEPLELKLPDLPAPAVKNEPDNSDDELEELEKELIVE